MNIYAKLPETLDRSLNSALDVALQRNDATQERKAGMTSDKPTIIKKYANRRLYHTGTSTYVTLDDLARMVKDAGGIPAHGNQRSQWDAGCRFDHPNPDYR